MPLAYAITGLAFLLWILFCYLDSWNKYKCIEILFTLTNNFNFFLLLIYSILEKKLQNF